MPVTRAGIDPSASGGTRCSATANSPSDRSAYSARAAATAAPVIDLASSNSVFALGNLAFEPVAAGFADGGGAGLPGDEGQARAGGGSAAGQGGGQDLTEGAGEEGLLDLEAARAPRRPAGHCQQ